MRKGKGASDFQTLRISRGGGPGFLVSWNDSKSRTRCLFRFNDPGHISAFYQVVLMDGYRDLRLDPGDIVLDAGANIGVFTVIAAKSVGPRGFVIAVEPDIANTRQLVENCRINNLSNVAIIQQALWSTSGKHLAFEGEGLFGKLVSYDDPVKEGRRIVETVSADDIFDRLGLSRIDKVKMDVEGSELAILESSNDLYRARNIVLEIHREKSIDRVLRLLSSHGFALTRLVRGSEDFQTILRSSIRHPFLVARVETANQFRTLRRVVTKPFVSVGRRLPGELSTLASFTRSQVSKSST